MPRFQDIVTDNEGNGLPGAIVTVRDYPSGNLSTLTADSGGSLTNPIVADANGAYYFNAANAIYSLEFRLLPYEPAREVRLADLGNLVDSVTLATTLSIIQYHAKDAGLVGDGSDETAKLTAFWNHAIANPGVPHVLESKTYGVSSVLPTINVDGVIIVGARGDYHDDPPTMTGTVIKWVGGSSSGKMLTVTPVTGATGQYLTGIVLRGIGFDCNSLIATAVRIESVRNGEFTLVGMNSTSILFDLGVTSGTLGEGADLQDNLFRLYGRQVEQATGVCLQLSGTASANVSFNDFFCTFEHNASAAVVCVNSDNNDWHRLRCFTAGSATESVHLLGGASSGVSCRAENFHHFSANKPAKVYGTDAYTAASVQHIMFLDGANGTPNPIVSPGASIVFTSNTKQTWVTPEQFGAKGDGTTDDSVAIQAAINSGKLVRLQSQTTYAIASTLNIGNGTSTTLSTLNGVVIEGSTSGAAASEFSGGAVRPTCIKWIGASSGVMVNINGPIVGVNISGIFFDANNLAATTIYRKHMLASTWQDIVGGRYIGTCFIAEAYASVGGVFVNGSQRNTFINVRAKNPGTGGSGIRLGVTSGFVNGMLDVAQEAFINCEFYRDGGTGGTFSAQFSFCDNISFMETAFWAQSGSSGNCIYILPPTGTGNFAHFPQEISFYNCAIQGGFTTDASWAPVSGILCMPYPTADGEPIPTNANIAGIDFSGRWFGSGIGYATGMGGTVTQATSKATGVTLNKLCGSITLNNAALAAGAIVSFTLTNSFILADDELLLRLKSGYATAATYKAWAEGTAAGSRTICVQNVSGGSLSEAVVAGFILFRGQSS